MLCIVHRGSLLLLVHVGTLGKDSIFLYSSSDLWSRIFCEEVKCALNIQLLGSWILLKACHSGLQDIISQRSLKGKGAT